MAATSFSFINGSLNCGHKSRASLSPSIVQGGGKLEMVAIRRALARLTDAIQNVGPPFRPECQYRDNKYHKH
jgi:hypothetical protein